MSSLTANEVRGMMGAYNSVYDAQEENQLAEEIFDSISYTLISQGYTAIDVLEYFANVDDEVIIEDIAALSEGTLIFEEVVSEEYVDEQMQQLDEVVGALLRIGGAAMKAAKYAPKAASLGQRALSALGGAGRAATRVAQQGTKASAVVRPALAKGANVVKGAASGAKNLLGRAVTKIKGVARGALDKLPGGSKGKIASALKTAGKWALGGAGFEAGMRGTSALLDKMGQKKSQSAPAKTTPSKAPTAPSPKPSSSAPAPRSSTSAPAPRSSTSVSPKMKPSKPVVKQTGNKSKDMETWAKANPTLAAKLTPSGTQKGTGKSQMEKDAEELRQMQKRSKERQGVKTESYDAYDVVLEYLFDNGHVETVEEAHYVMMEMDSESIQSIVEAYGSFGANMAGAELQRRQTEKVRQQEREKIEQEKKSAASQVRGA